MVAGGRMGEGIVREYGMDRYTLAVEPPSCV